MRSPRLGRVLITAVALFWALGGVAADFNETHVFNPDWPPHARFHAAFQLVLAACTTAVALRIVWSRGPGNGTLLVAIYPAAFFVTALVPGVAFSDPGQPTHEIGGLPGQIVMAIVSLSVLAFGWALCGLAHRSHDPTLR